MNLNPESNIVFDKYYKLSSTFKFYFFIQKITIITIFIQGSINPLNFFKLISKNSLFDFRTTLDTKMPLLIVLIDFETDLT